MLKPAYQEAYHDSALTFMGEAFVSDAEGKFTDSEPLAGQISLDELIAEMRLP